jgi:RimJ/RimL family protein N-acetyltransferase
MADTFALPVLATDRLILRSPQLTDAQDIFFLRSDATINKYLKGFSHETIEQTLAFCRTVLLSAPSACGISHKKLGRLTWAIHFFPHTWETDICRKR